MSNQLLKDFLGKAKEPTFFIYAEEHPNLREQTSKVTDFSLVPALKDKMIQTMKESNGIGLAAPQIGLPLKIFVISFMVGQDRDGNLISDEFIVVNPEIQEKEGSACIEEGCLSVKGERVEVPRAARILASWQDESGKKLQARLSGINSICFQHELDHLDGKLITDYKK